MKRTAMIAFSGAILLMGAPAENMPLGKVVLEQIDVRSHTLSGGLSVAFSPMPKTHTVSIAVAYGVGSADEEPAAAGAAHLLEHMMFGGTTTFKRGVFASAIAQSGGLANARTSFTHTVYFSTVSKADLPKLLEMEADRMTGLVFDPELFAREKSIAAGEYRSSILNRPFGRSIEAAVRASGGGDGSWAHLPVGTMATIDGLDLATVRRLYEGYYTPENCAIAVVGDIDEQWLIGQIREKFSAPARQGRARRSALDATAHQLPRRATLLDALAPGRRVDMLYRVPLARVWQRAGLKRLADVLAARIRNTMYGPSAPKSVVSAVPIEQGSQGLLWISASMLPDAAPERLGEAIASSLQQLSDSGLRAEEAQYIRRAVAEEMGNLAENGLARAIRMATERIDHDDPAAINAMAALRLDLPQPQWRELIARIVATQPAVIVTDPAPRTRN